MVKFVVAKLENRPAVTWNELAVAVADHALLGRTQWKWKQLEADSHDPHVMKRGDFTAQSFCDLVVLFLQ